jgi:hypothetical protein
VIQNKYKALFAKKKRYVKHTPTTERTTQNKLGQSPNMHQVKGAMSSAAPEQP